MNPIGQCPVCGYYIYPEHDVQLIPPPGKARLGGKSGLLVSEANSDEPGVIVHYGCAAGFFDPRSNQRYYDDMYDRVGQQVYYEKLDELTMMAEKKAEENLREELDGVRDGRLCIDCRQDIEELQERMARDGDD